MTFIWGAYFWSKIDFFKVVLDMFRKCLVFVFGVKGSTLRCILSFEDRYMTLKIEILGQQFDHFGRFEGSFLTILGVKKVDFWTFSKLFWTCLGSVWALFLASKGLLLSVFSALKVDK